MLFRLRHPFRKSRDLMKEIARRSRQSAPPHWEEWEGMLKRYVQDDGKVRYAEWAGESQSLEKVIEAMGRKAPTEEWPRDEQLAYWINMYNAATVSLMLKNYPVASIREIKNRKGIPFLNSIFDRPFVPVAGLKLSLNDIEHRILRRLNEPRIHFAINCASESCPALANKAYRGRELEKQLQSGALRFLTDPAQNSFGSGQSELSPIFNWFMDDFGGEEGLKEKIKSWTGRTELPKKIRFKKYNWKINNAGDDQKVD